MADEERSLAALSRVPDLEVPHPKRPRVPDVARPAAAAPDAGLPGAFDDDFGLELERNITSLPDVSARAAGRPAPQGPIPHVPSGLDVAYRRLEPTPLVSKGPSRIARVLGSAGAVIVVAATFAALLRFVHRPSGVVVTSLLPQAFDGTSAAASGAVAIMAFIASFVIGYAGVRTRTRSWMLVGSSAATMLAALAMITVTLGSTGESTVPPDGALLVPWVLPIAMVLGGIHLVRRASRDLTAGAASGVRGAIPRAAVAALLLFAAIEVTSLAALLPAIG